MKIDKTLVGKKITLVSRGIRRSNYSKPWVDEHDKGQASFFEVSRVGRKYIYGHYYYNGPEEGLRRSTYEAKVLFEDYVLHFGFDRLAVKRYKQYIQSLEEYDELRKKGMREIDHEIYEIKSQLIEKWDGANPRPEALKV